MESSNKPENTASSGTPTGTNSNAATAKPSTTANASAGVPPVQPPKPKGYTNPALQAMGIPRLRLPSRNWSIFWGVVIGVSGLIVYDRRERKNRRQFWKDQVSSFATVPMGAMELPRRVTVYMAPPPNDYLEITQQHFRQYIKPVLTAAAVDYTVVSESRQGEIRAKVAENIRNKRRRMHNLPTSEEDSENSKDDLDKQIERGIERDNTGGVICIGRGAYKEYLNGLQEGWLGPLEAPVEPEPENLLVNPTIEAAETLTENAMPVETLDSTNMNVNTQQQIVSTPIPQAKTTEKEQTDAAGFPNAEDDERDILGYKESDEAAAAKSAEEAKDTETETKSDKETEEKKDTRPPVTKPYIIGMNRGPESWSSELPAGADADLLAARPEDVSDPIAILEHRHVLGFLNTPIRVKRFFSRRLVSDQLGQETSAVIFNDFRPFKNKTSPAAVSGSVDSEIAYSDNTVLEDAANSLENDVDRLIIAETEDWPKRWKTKAVDNNSEWIWPFGVDSRIASKLRVYDTSAELQAKFDESKKNYSQWKKDQEEKEAKRLKELENGPTESSENL